MSVSYIKKLSLDGFKSFRHKTDIVFEPGFNAIVGPNGSGKSNMLDACVFVFGFPSRFLRTSKMGNVLYQGNEKKKKTRYCSVEAELLKINDDGTEEEIIISRKINPQGVSYYRLNNKGVSKSLIDKVLEEANIKPRPIHRYFTARLDSTCALRMICSIRTRPTIGMTIKPATSKLTP